MMSQDEDTSNTLIVVSRTEPTEVECGEEEGRLDAISRALSLYCRHFVGQENWKPPRHGWCRFDDLLNTRKFRRLAKDFSEGKAVRRAVREEIVAIARWGEKRWDCQISTTAKGPTILWIRACHGHSFKVDDIKGLIENLATKIETSRELGPDELYHNTAIEGLQEVLENKKIKKMQRGHIHIFRNENDIKSSRDDPNIKDKRRIIIRFNRD